MDTLNKTLKIIFIVSTIVLLTFLLALPKTDCDMCKFEYDGKSIGALQAYEIFEKDCISYAKPWDAAPELNYTR